MSTEAEKPPTNVVDYNGAYYFNLLFGKGMRGWDPPKARYGSWVRTIYPPEGQAFTHSDKVNIENYLRKEWQIGGAVEVKKNGALTVSVLDLSMKRWSKEKLGHASAGGLRHPSKETHPRENWFHADRVRDRLLYDMMFGNDWRLPPTLDGRAVQYRPLQQFFDKNESQEAGNGEKLVERAKVLFHAATGVPLRNAGIIGGNLVLEADHDTLSVMNEKLKSGAIVPPDWSHVTRLSIPRSKDHARGQ